MKVVIMTDLEGVSGVDDPIQVQDEAGEGYRFAVERLMADLNAAVEGAYEGGATEVFVVDGHGDGNNFIHEKLHEKAKQISISEWQELIRSRTVGAYMEIGCHAMAGTLNGFFDHTQSWDTWHNYYVNGERMGEIGQGAVFVGAYDVPMVMVAGDEAACNEGKKLLGDIAVAVVKHGRGWASADCVELSDAESRIRAAARDGVLKAKEIAPCKIKLPAEVKLEFSRADKCEEVLSYRSDVERLDARTIRTTVHNIHNYADILF